MLPYIKDTQAHVKRDETPDAQHDVHESLIDRSVGARDDDYDTPTRTQGSAEDLPSARSPLGRSSASFARNTFDTHTYSQQTNDNPVKQNILNSHTLTHTRASTHGQESPVVGA